MARRETRPGRGLSFLLVISLGVAVPAAARDEPPPPPTFTAVLGRILELEDTRAAGEGELERLLRHKEAGIRRRAALAAGRIGDSSVVPTLLELMNDSEIEVEKVAIFSLGLIGDAAARDRLLAALGDSEPVVRGRAAEALGRIGGVGVADAVADFVLRSMPRADGAVTVRGDDPGNPDDPWVELRLGLLALATLEDKPAARKALVRGGRPRFDWWVSTWVAMRLEDPAFVPVLMAAARSDDVHSRALAARGLGSLKDPSALEVLIHLTRDENDGVVFEALRALGRLGDERARSRAATLMSSPSDVVRRQALLALANLPPDSRLRSRIVPLVGDPSPWIRSAALAALARTDRDNFALVLSGMDPDPVWWVRAALARVLGEVADEMSVGILHGMLDDDDGRVRPAVLTGLARARGSDAADTLRRALDDPDPAVRAAAARGLTTLEATGSVPALRGAWEMGLNDGEVEARLAVVDALGALGEPDAASVLRDVATKDPSRPVRARAARLLARDGTPAPDPGPQEVDRPVVDYRVAMGPHYPLPGVPLFTPRVFLRTAHGTIEIHLDVLEAPLTSASFVRLARRGFYDGLTFHRVEPGFVVQEGGPRGDGYGGPGYTLRSEVTRRPFGTGSLGIADSGNDTGGSQFFITLSPQPHLDGRHTRFGTVVSGLEILDSIRPEDEIERIEVWTGE